MSAPTSSPPPTNTGPPAHSPDPDQKLNPVKKKFYREHIKQFIEEKIGLEKFYNGPQLKDLGDDAKRMGDKLIKIGCTPELSLVLSRLLLYDIVMLLDDSSSMNYEEDGKRKETMKKTLNEITAVYDLANPTGIKAVQFLNAGTLHENIRNSNVHDLFKDRIYSGVTMIGTELQRKVLDKFVFMKESMLKPLIVMTITDGEIEGESKFYLKYVIVECMNRLEKESRQADVVFHFSQVGNDLDAKEMLRDLDRCKEVGRFIDCLQVDLPLEKLSDENSKWQILTKLLLGATNKFWDMVRLDLELYDPEAIKAPEEFKKEDVTEEEELIEDDE